MSTNKIVSRDEWTAARKELLRKEKELTRLQDDVSRQRRELPWVRIDKEYVFETPDGKKTLAQLFDGRGQLIVYHFMFTPGWQAGCPGCSFLADHVDGANMHLKNHDVTFVAVARASLSDLQAYKNRMGWAFPLVSSAASDFNYDFGVSFRKEDVAKGKVYYNYELTDAAGEDLHGSSVFIKDDDGAIYHTYSSYARGGERWLGTYAFLDVTPKGRQENGPGFNLTDWVRRHDEYGKPNSGWH